MSGQTNLTMARYVEAARLLGTPGAQHFERDRILRLREDIDAFRRDLRHLNNGGILILAPDSAEIDSYVRPEDLLGVYCFPIEDRATYDLKFAERQGRKSVFDPSNQIRKIGRRVLRARAHLFNSSAPNLLLPPYLGELDATLSLILSERRKDDLGAVFQAIADNIHRLRENDAQLLEEISRFDDLKVEQRNRLLDSIFDRIVANPVMFSDDMALEERAQRISRIARAGDFLKNTSSLGLEDYEWSTVLGTNRNDLVDKLRSIVPDKTLIQYIENLFYKLPHGRRTSLSVYADTRSLAYIAAINGCLIQNGFGKIKVQLVSWALSPVTVARAFWPEPKGSEGPIPLVEVRHPKLLAAAIDFKKVNQIQVESELERFSEALNLFESREEHESAEVHHEKIDTVRMAWEQLDNTLLAWTAPIGERKSDGTSAGTENLAKIRQIVVDHRDVFEDYLVLRIDNVSKSLSDSHWAVVRPENVTDIEADCLLYEPGYRIVLRPRADHARCAIALYNPEIVEYIHDSFENNKSIGHTLLELTRTYSIGERLYESNPIFRAETQLLKAFLFAILANNVLAARYCGLARAELRQSGEASQVRSEILYLAHYAHRGLGREKRSKDEFLQSLKLLEESKAAWKPTEREPRQKMLPRYFVSWVTTCRDVAAASVPEFVLDDRYRDLAVKAYDGCLSVLKYDIAVADRPHVMLETYQIGRAAQNVMFVFLFEKLGIGTWRESFSNVFRPTEDQARLAWRVLKEMRASLGGWQGPKNMKRNDLAYFAASYWFGEGATEREEAWSALLDMRADFREDSTMFLVMSEFVRKARAK